MVTLLSTAMTANPVAGGSSTPRPVELVPPRQFALRWQRPPLGLLAADQVAAHRHHRFAPLRPQGGDDVRAARPRLLAVARRVRGDEAGGAIAPGEWHNHPVPPAASEGATSA